ncbi:MAG TPA: hypothetical protein VFI04_04825 [Gaiellaceae bacterium]|jgi:hypothetical protein|nr:hypothetical protein [Gaiellaceae bacterium]
MTATSFDVPMFHRRSDVVTTLLASLEQREAAVAEREAAIARRERAIEYEERFHELRGFSAGGAEATENATRRIEPPARYRFHTTFGLRELEWWTKQLGYVPALT